MSSKKKSTSTKVQTDVHPKSREETQRLIQRAQGKIETAKGRCLSKYPLHAAMLSAMPVLACSPETCPTMAVQATKEGVNLLHNPEFVLKITLPELVGVLLHETHHVIFNHLFMKESDFPNYPALVIAQEVTVNEFIKEPLPKGAVLLKNYPMLKPLTSTKERYRILEKSTPYHKVVLTLDDHGKWHADASGSLGSDEEKQEAVEQMLEEAMNSTPPDQIPEDLKTAIYGSGSGSYLEQVYSTRSSKTPWEKHLLGYVGSLLSVKPTYLRPPRRFPDMIGILPGTYRLAEKPKIMAQIDTSGSITSELLVKIDENLRTLARKNDLTIVEFGDEVYRTYPYKGRLIEVEGRSGNNGAPGLVPKFLARYKPDVIIIMTDGYLCVPSTHETIAQPPKVNGRIVPVIWAILPDGIAPTKWGKYVWLKD